MVPKCAVPLASMLTALPSTALAHHATAGAGHGIEQVLIVLLVASAVGYASGVARLWRKAGTGRGIGRLAALSFALGWVTLAIALLSPIDDLATNSFALHMAQHEMLMVVAAPLFALSKPMEAWAWALSPGGRRILSVAAGWWRRLAVPGIAWWLHAAAIWVWHIPALFVAALGNIALHDLQHVCFFASALLFWQSVFGRDIHARAGIAMALLITTMLHTSALGLLLTFSPTAWYAHDAPVRFGLTALEDQQLGGLIMWMVGSIPYVAAALLIAAAWLSPSRTSASPRPRTSP